MKIMDYLDSQPEFSKTLGDYVTMLVSQTRITKGREMLEKYKPIFEKVEKAYGVDRYVVAAIWGIETSYGDPKGIGTRSVLRSTATLACIGPAAGLFPRRIHRTLQIIDRGDVPADHMKGSWAGAFGPTQFMPTSFLRYAVDFDGDGHRNVVDSIPDVIASTANNLKLDGWQFGQTWGYEVVLPQNFDYRYVGSDQALLHGQWASLGIRRANGRRPSRVPATPVSFCCPPVPRAGLHHASEFRCHPAYNPADAYALAIGHLADRLRGRRRFRAAWPKEGAGALAHRAPRTPDRLSQMGYDIGNIDGILGRRPAWPCRTSRPARA